MVGHNDIRPTNIMFETINGMQLATGLIDLNSAIPITLAQEFRHVHMVDAAASQAAAEAFETKTGTVVSLDRIAAWAGFQAVTAAMHFALAGDSFRLGYNRAALERLYPDDNWSELDQFTTVRQ